MENRAKAEVGLFGEFSSDRHHTITAGTPEPTAVQLPRRTEFVIIFDQYQCVHRIETYIMEEFPYRLP
jgi:hypothetical protein